MNSLIDCKVVYTHFKIPKFTSRRAAYATVAFAIQENKLTYAIAFCASQDRFVKKVGRELAFKYLFDDQRSRIIEGNIDSRKMRKFGYYNIAKELLLLDLNMFSCPSWFNNLYHHEIRGVRDHDTY